MKLTPEYLEMLRLEAVGRNNKIYYGSDIPSMFIETGLNIPTTPNKKVRKSEALINDNE